MGDIQYNLQFELLCKKLNLGDIVSEPKGISGGLLHRMYAVTTTQGAYAIKALNPHIMLRPVAMQNYLNSERIASIAVNNIPALPAIMINGIVIQEIDKQYYLVFNWVNGNRLKQNEINVVHCEKIGAILGDIHRTDFSELDIISECSSDLKIIDWNYYLHKGQKNNAVWVNLLNDNLVYLYDWNTKANNSANLLKADLVISHRDLDPKNVMWIQNKPIVIDWESAGYINPMQDLIETAIYWSEKETVRETENNTVDDTINVDKERFFAFISGYKKNHGTINANWRAVLDSGFTSKLDWLEYSLKRSLGMECTDIEEQQMGTDQVIGTIDAIKNYADMISEIETWLNN